LLFDWQPNIKIEYCIHNSGSGRMQNAVKVSIAILSYYEFLHSWTEFQKQLHQQQVCGVSGSAEIGQCACACLPACLTKRLVGWWIVWLAQQSPACATKADRVALWQAIKLFASDPQERSHLVHSA
jgi:hypothetical protein